MQFTQLFPRLSDGFCVAGVLSDGTPYAAIVKFAGPQTMTIINNADQFTKNYCKTCEFYQKNQPEDFDPKPQENLYRRGENTVCLTDKPIRCLKNIPLLPTEDIEVNLPSQVLFYNAKSVTDFLTSSGKFPKRRSGEYELFDVNLDALTKHRTLEMSAFQGCNVFEYGKICWGKNPEPKSLRQAYDVFWHSIFNFDLAKGTGSLKSSLQSYEARTYEEGHRGSRRISLHNTGSRLVRGTFGGCFVASGVEKEYWINQLPLDKQAAAKKQRYIVGFFREASNGQKGAMIEINGMWFLKETKSYLLTTGKAKFLYDEANTFSSMAL